MNRMVLNKQEKMLFALLRASLHRQKAETAYFQGASDEDWKRCYQLAARQGVMALAWEGIVTLPQTIVLLVL